ncbi:hypothetical protein [Reichenbachiella sp.]|uniref:hypothetical protein n=1 Tax=Reichenbachiella sp. TaxID=2184521 RepID=UPI003BAED012
MKKEKYKEDLESIRDIMVRSSRFISLSGWSGVSAGIVALAGAFGAYQTVYTNQNYLGFRSADLAPESLWTLLMLAIVTLGLSLGLGIYFTTRAAKKQGQNIWDHQTKRLLTALAIPLVAGGLLCCILLSKGFVGLVAPLTLVFYGLALVNASKYTLTEVKSLGLIEIVLGLMATYYIGFGLLFWSIGFGVVHIIYGIMMEVKYRS